MDFTTRRERYRGILAGDKCVYPGSVFDPISARIAEDLGFEVGMFAGSVASMTVLGAPDLIVLTLSEFAQQAYRINRAGELPLLVDADHGYGNALNVKRTVEELESAGVAALTIEDTDLPQPHGTVGATRLIPIDEGVGKMKAAIEGRSDPALVIAGVLHDTVEDTDTTPEEIEELFGANVRSLVMEVTDNKALAKSVRKRLQIEHAPHLSPNAKVIKLADKTANVTDLGHLPPIGWSIERRLNYLDWSQRVVAGCRGANSALEMLFDQRVVEARQSMTSYLN